MLEQRACDYSLHRAPHKLKLIMKMPSNLGRLVISTNVVCIMGGKVSGKVSGNVSNVV